MNKSPNASKFVIVLSLALPIAPRTAFAQFVARPIAAPIAGTLGGVAASINGVPSFPTLLPFSAPAAASLVGTPLAASANAAVNGSNDQLTGTSRQIAAVAAIGRNFQSVSDEAGDPASSLYGRMQFDGDTNRAADSASSLAPLSSPNTEKNIGDGTELRHVKSVVISPAPVMADLRSQAAQVEEMRSFRYNLKQTLKLAATPRWLLLLPSMALVVGLSNAVYGGLALGVIAALVSVAGLLVANAVMRTSAMRTMLPKPDAR